MRAFDDEFAIDKSRFDNAGGKASRCEDPNFCISSIEELDEGHEGSRRAWLGDVIEMKSLSALMKS